VFFTSRSCNEILSSTPILISNQSSECSSLIFEDPILSDHETEDCLNQVTRSDATRQPADPTHSLDLQIGRSVESVKRSQLLDEVVAPSPAASFSIQIATNPSPASGDYQPVITRIPIRSHCQTGVYAPISW
jgi:hypothetical protein